MANIPKGTLDLLVMRTLRRGPMHGYAISAELREASDDFISVEEGALYPALHRMERKGWLESEWRIHGSTNRRARFYRLTDEGKRQLKAMRSEWRSSTQVIGRVLGVDLS